MKNGKVIQVIGAVVDIEFGENVPAIYNAINVKKEDGSTLVLEVASHLGEGRVRSCLLYTSDAADE